MGILTRRSHFQIYDALIHLENVNKSHCIPNILLSKSSGWIHLSNSVFWMLVLVQRLFLSHSPHHRVCVYTNNDKKVTRFGLSSPLCPSFWHKFLYGSRQKGITVAQFALLFKTTNGGYQCCNWSQLLACRNDPSTKTASPLWAGSGVLREGWRWTNWDVPSSGMMARRAWEEQRWMERSAGGGWSHTWRAATCHWYVRWGWEIRLKCIQFRLSWVMVSFFIYCCLQLAITMEKGVNYSQEKKI